VALRILQFGRSGQVGTELLSKAIARGHDIAALGRDIIDLAQPDRIPWAVSAAGRVDVVINGAAYTQVDKAEAEPERAALVNSDAARVLAETCAKRNLPLIHLSTDYVFDGRKSEPYLEEDTPAPLNVYGRTKLLGEIAVRECHPAHIILRTSWVYSAHGTNFVRTMLRLGTELDELRIVDDQRGAPTAAGDIAEACLTLCEAIVQRRAATPWGTYHFTAAGETTWFGFAKAIFEDAASWYGRRPVIVPIASSAYAAAASRPLNSRLNCEKIVRNFGILPRPWRQGLDEVLAALRGSWEKDA